MRRLIVLAIGLAVLAWPAIAGSDFSQITIRSIGALELEEADARERLLGAIQSEDRRVWRTAVAELRGGFSDDPAVTMALLKLIAPEAVTEAPATPLSEQSRTNILNILANLADTAWTADTVAQARDILDSYGAARHFRPGRAEQRYMLALSERLAGFSAADYSFGEVQGRVVGKVRFTDVDVFICDYATGDDDLVLRARAFGEKLAAANFGRIRLRVAEAGLAKAVTATRGASTIVIDKGEDEAALVSELAGLAGALGLPDVRRVANSGSPSPWYLSVFICP